MCIYSYLVIELKLLGIIASQVKEEADELAQRYGVSSEYLDASDDQALKKIASSNRLVISLLPYELHGAVARACVSSRTHMVTASYVRPEVQEVDEE